MESPVRSSVQTPRLDARSLIAAGLCVLALFFDVLGWILALAGIVLLRRATFSRTVKCLLAAIAFAPKVLFIGVRSLNAPGGLSFPIEPRNLATSSSLWAWSIFLAAFGVYLISLPRRLPQDPNAPVEPRPYRTYLFAGSGVVSIAIAVVLLLGLTEAFHRIDDAGQGQWALRHVARGNVAIFTGTELQTIDAVERYNSRSGRTYSVRIVLAGGRSFSITTPSAAALEELRKFAATADLRAGKMRIIRRNGSVWTNGASGFTLKDCVGIYELADESSLARSTFEFWLEGGRLVGKETVADSERRHVRVLRNIKISDSGDMDFQPSAYLEASQQDKGTLSFSLRWSSQGETARLVKDELQVGTQHYRKQ